MYTISWFSLLAQESKVSNIRAVPSARLRTAGKFTGLVQRLARQPSGAVLHLSSELNRVNSWQSLCHDDSTIKNVTSIVHYYISNSDH